MPSRIEAYAKKVNQREFELRQIERKFQREQENVILGWEGSVSKVFLQQNKKVQRKINKMYSNIGKIESELRRLATQVRRADRERQLEAERLRRKQLEQGRYL